MRLLKDIDVRRPLIYPEDRFELKLSSDHDDYGYPSIVDIWSVTQDAVSFRAMGSLSPELRYLSMVDFNYIYRREQWGGTPLFQNQRQLVKLLREVKCDTNPSSFSA